TSSLKCPFTFKPMRPLAKRSRYSIAAKRSYTPNRLLRPVFKGSDGGTRYLQEGSNGFVAQIAGLLGSGTPWFGSQGTLPGPPWLTTPSGNVLGSSLSPSCHIQ